MTYMMVDSGTNRDAWLAARRTGITATDVARLASGGAAVIAAIKAEKAGFDRVIETAAMRHGKDREPVIADFAADRFALAHSTALLGSRDHTRHLATPDMLGANTVGEIKTTVHDWQTVEDVPRRYLDQMQWEMHVTGAARCFLIFEPHENFVPTYMEPKHFIILANPERQAELVALADAFLASDDEPDEEAAELEVLLNAYLDEKELEDAQHARTDIAKAALEERIAGKPTKHVGSRAFLTRSEDSTRRQFSATRLKDDHPELWDAYAEPIPVKGRLTITVRTDG